MEKVLTYTEACSMYDFELEEMNAAIDVYCEIIAEQSRKGGK